MDELNLKRSDRNNYIVKVGQSRPHPAVSLEQHQSSYANNSRECIEACNKIACSANKKGAKFNKAKAA